MTTEKSKGLREFWIETDGDNSFQIVFYEEPEIERDTLIHVREVSPAQDAAVLKLLEALKLHHKIWRHEYGNKFCSTECKDLCTALADYEALR